MGKTIKELKKELVKLDEEKLKEVLNFVLSDEEETEEEIEVTKEVVQEEPKKEVVEEEKEEPTYVTLQDLEAFKETFLQQVQGEQVKAKPFGVDTSKGKPKAKDKSKTTQDYLNMVNQRR